jgi:hypothetical protein
MNLYMIRELPVVYGGYWKSWRLSRPFVVLVTSWIRQTYMVTSIFRDIDWSGLIFRVGQGTKVRRFGENYIQSPWLELSNAFRVAWQSPLQLAQHYSRRFGLFKGFSWQGLWKRSLSFPDL